MFFLFFLFFLFLMPAMALTGNGEIITTDSIVVKSAMEDKKNVFNLRADLLKKDFAVKVEDIKGNKVRITIFGIRLTPKGDTNGENLHSAKRVKIASGILDAAIKSGRQDLRGPFFKVIEVQRNEITFEIPNYAKTAGVPVVEHIWGIGEEEFPKKFFGHLVLDPADPWVVYKEEGGSRILDGKKPDLDTLAIGLVMYPNGPTVSLKGLSLGKIDQGKRPEDLAK